MEENIQEIDITPTTRLAKSIRNSSHTNLSALGDLVDNSVDAEANVIRIDIHTSEESNGSQIVVSDDGFGMSKFELTRALSLGGHGDNGNLGIFGLGLKIACGHFSTQFEIFTKSKTSNDILYVKYDSELINSNNNWKLPFHVIQVDDVNNKTIIDCLTSSGTGTFLRILNVDKFEHKNIGSFIDNLIVSLGINHGGYIPSAQSPDTKSKLKIFVQGREVFGLDTLERHLDATEIPINETHELSGKGKVTVTMSLLPYTSLKRGHGKKLNNVPVKKEKWNFPPSGEHQGISIIRNNRGIVNFQTGGAFTFLYGKYHQSNNYHRIQIKFDEADNHFKVNAEKTEITWMTEEVRTILTHILEGAITIARRMYLSNEGGMNDPEATEFIKKYNERFAVKSNTSLISKKKKKVGKKKVKKTLSPNQRLTIVSTDMTKDGKMWGFNNETACSVSLNNNNEYYKNRIQTLPAASIDVLGEILFSFSDNLSKIIESNPELTDMLDILESNITNDLKLRVTL